MKSIHALAEGLTDKEFGRLRNGTKWGLAAPTHSKLRDRGLLECVDIGRANLRAIATELGCQVITARGYVAAAYVRRASQKVEGS